MSAAVVAALCEHLLARQSAVRCATLPGDDVPKTAENFRALSTGAPAYEHRQHEHWPRVCLAGQELTRLPAGEPGFGYKGSKFHREPPPSTPNRACPPSTHAGLAANTCFATQGSSRSSCARRALAGIAAGGVCWALLRSMAHRPARHCRVATSPRATARAASRSTEPSSRTRTSSSGTPAQASAQDMLSPCLLSHSLAWQAHCHAEL